MIIIYWHCLGMTEADETFVNSALKELAQHLKEDQIKLTISVKRLASEPDLVREVNEVLNKPNDQSSGFSYYVAMILGIFSCHVGVGQPFTYMRLLVYCHQDSQVAKAAKSEAARMNKAPPCWGAANSPLAAAYKVGSKVAVWHEALHLLGADDCYIEDDPYQKKPDCELDGCIMEYAPLESTCENWPFLCDENIKKLKDTAEKAKEVRRTKKDS